ncbi:hypothetical protein E8E11_007961 [Didymella keratinophila]|nr:hypothetical protein E8E11_007961 [Didymella keratinophila]
MGAWGHGLFQSDNDLDTVSELGHEMGLSKLEEDMEATAKAEGKSEEEVRKIYLTICGGGSHRETWETNMLTVPNGSKDQQLEYLFRDPVYYYVLLGACAMTLGCHLPDSFLNMLKIVYTESGFLSPALKQLHKALFGPKSFKNGEPYDFESKSLVETANSKADDELPSAGAFKMMNVMGGPGSMFGPKGTNSIDSVIMKELRSKIHKPDVCGECSASHGDAEALEDSQEAVQASHGLKLRYTTRFVTGELAGR